MANKRGRPPVKTYTLSDLASEFGMPVMTLYHRLWRGASLAQALTTPYVARAKRKKRRKAR